MRKLLAIGLVALLSFVLACKRSETSVAQVTVPISEQTLSTSNPAPTVIQSSIPPDVLRDIHGYPKVVPDKAGILRAFLQEDFVELNILLEGYQKLFDEDFHNEYLAINCYTPFSVTDPAYLSKLDKWIETTPDNYTPYIARGTYYYYLAGQARGSKLARDTSDEQFEKMRNYAYMAEKDIAQGLQINGRVLQAYRMTMYIRQLYGDLSGGAAALEKSISVCPECFILPMTFVENITPRWGGSYELMDKMASQAQKHAGTNPKLRLLLGASYADRAHMSEKNRLMDQAMEQINKALSYGDMSEWLIMRSWLHYKESSYQEALGDIDRAIDLSRDHVKARVMRAMVLKKVNRKDEAVEDVVYAYKLNPTHEYLAEQRDWALKRVLKSAQGLSSSAPGKALEQLEVAAALGATDQETAAIRCLVLWKMGKRTESREFLHNVAPDDQLFIIHRSLNGGLARFGTDVQVSFWQDYISTYPDEPGGYLFLAHGAIEKKNFPEATALLIRAMEKKPGDRDLGYKIYEAVTLFGETEEQIGFWDTMVQDMPREPVGFYYRGYFYNKAGREGEALAYFKKACDFGYDGGCDRYRSLTSDSKKSPDKQPSPESLSSEIIKPFKRYDEVKRKVAAQDRNGAMYYLVKVVDKEKGPYYYSMLWQANFASSSSRHRSEGYRYLTEGMKKFPGSLILEADYADFMLRTGDLEGAFERARGLFAQHKGDLDREVEERLIGVLLKCYRNYGYFKEMTGLYEYLIGKYPGREEYLVASMELDGLMGRYDAAAAKFKLCLQNSFLGEHLAGALAMMSLASYYNDDLEYSLRLQEKLYEIADPGRYLLSAAMASLMTDFRTAEMSQKVSDAKVGQGDPRKGVLFSALWAKSYDQLSLFNEDHVTRRQDLTPVEKSVLVSALIKIKHPMAVNVARELTEEMPENAYYRYLLGSALQKTGDTEAASHLKFAAQHLPNALFRKMAGL